MEKNINISVNSKVFAATALGAGVLVGASTAYILTRIHEHSNLTHLVSHLHNTINEVKEEITFLENELGLLQRSSHPSDEKFVRKRHRKTVSFSSSATASSYKTAIVPPSDDASYRSSADYPDSQSEVDCCWRSSSNDTDYFSPEEDEDEFFDVISTDEECYESGVPSIASSDVSDYVSDLTKLIKKVDSLIDKSPDEQIRAYNLLMDKGRKYNDNAEVLWRKAKATNNMAAIEDVKGNMKEKKKYIFEAYEYAKKALEINDASADVHKWFAILSGSRGEFLSTRERIASGHVFKEHVDIALQISPNDSVLHHLLGRFCFEVSSLSWLERKVASGLFGEVPSASFEEALSHFMAAEDLKPWKENKLYIAKCHFEFSNKEEGEIWLREALRIPPKTAEDELVDKEIEVLMKRYSIKP